MKKQVLHATTSRDLRLGTTVVPTIPLVTKSPKVYLPESLETMLATDGTLAQAGLVIEIQETIHALDIMHAVTLAVSFQLLVIGIYWNIYVISFYNLQPNSCLYL